MGRNSLFWGLVLILAGAVFLLDTLGIFQGINVWGIIWPLVIIALGVFTLWGALFRRSPQMESAAIPLEGAGRARVRVQHGAGRISLSAGAASGRAVDGEFGGGVDYNARRNGDSLDVNLRVPSQFFPVFWTPGYTLDWNVRLNQSIPLELELEAGAGEARLDLSELQVARLRLSTGASSTHLTLPANAGYTRADLHSGAASIDVTIPDGVAARIRTRGGLSSVQVDAGRFPRSGELFETPGFAEAPNRVDLDVEMGVGSVTVR